MQNHFSFILFHPFHTFSAFGIRGLTLEVIGEANDYVGKGLGGAEIIMRPHDDARFVPHQNVILRT